MQINFLISVAVIISALNASAKAETGQPIDATSKCLANLDAFECRDAYLSEKDPVKMKALISSTEKYCFSKKSEKNTGPCLFLGLFFLSKNEVARADKLMIDVCRSKQDLKICSILAGYYFEHDEKEKALNITKNSCSINEDIMQLYAYTPEEQLTAASDCQRVTQNSVMPDYYIKEIKKNLYEWDFPGLKDPNPPKEPTPEEDVAACVAGSRSCGYVLRYKVSEANVSKVTDKISNNCFLEAKNVQEGATDCAILGVYFLKHDQEDKALAHLAQDCKSNSLGCALLAGHYLQMKKDDYALDSMKDYCKNPSGLRSIGDGAPTIKECAAITSAKRIPASMQKFSEERLKGFLSEQEK